MKQFKSIKVYKLKQGEKVIFPPVETWYIDFNFRGNESSEYIIGEVEDYFIKDDFVIADILIYKDTIKNHKTGREQYFDFETLTPAISVQQISVNQIKLVALSLCSDGNQQSEIKNIKEQQHGLFTE